MATIQRNAIAFNTQCAHKMREICKVKYHVIFTCLKAEFCITSLNSTKYTPRNFCYVPASDFSRVLNKVI